MTKKMTDMNATERRAVARAHRAEAAIAGTVVEKSKGFTATYVKATASQVFHTAQAKLWDAAAASAEASGNVRLA